MLFGDVLLGESAAVEGRGAGFGEVLFGFDDVGLADGLLAVVEPEAEGIGEDAFGGLAGGKGLREEPVKLIERQRDLDGAKHFFFDPRGNASMACFGFIRFPLDDGTGGAAEFFGEFLAGEISGEA